MKTTVVTIEWVYAVGLELGLGGAAAAAWRGCVRAAAAQYDSDAMRAR
jgi:hypothetical protein